MATWFAFLPTATPGVHPVRLEHAPNLAVPAYALQERARTRTGRTWYGGPHTGPLDTHPRSTWPDADMTASLLVWLRRPAHKLPGGQPDEVWTLTQRGRVVRTPHHPPPT